MKRGCLFKEVFKKNKNKKQSPLAGVSEKQLKMGFLTGLCCLVSARPREPVKCQHCSMLWGQWCS